MNKTGGKETFKNAKQSELLSAMSESGMSCRAYTVYAWQSEKKKDRKDTAGKMLLIYLFTICSFIELVNHSSSHHYILRI